jgi:AraC-like DNA-binding protein
MATPAGGIEAEGIASIATISAEIGQESAAAFIRTFKKTAGPPNGGA